MLEAIVTIVFIIGLLNFAQEAPELIKNLFKGSMFDGINLNPKGQLKSNLANARKTVNQARGIAKTALSAPGRAARAGVKGLRKLHDAPGNIKSGIQGKVGGVIGSARGSMAGFKAGRNGKKGFGAFVSGLEGYYAGKDAGKKAGTTFGSAGMIKDAKASINEIARDAAHYGEHIKKFDHTRGQFKDATDKLYEGINEKIEKKKQEKTERANNLYSRISDQTDAYMKDSSWKSTAASTTQRDLIQLAMVKENKTYDDIIHDTKIMDEIGKKLIAAQAKGDYGFAQLRAEANEKMKDIQEDRKTDYEIAKIKGTALKDNAAASNLAVVEWQSQQAEWGTAVQDKFMESFSSALKDLKNAELIQSIDFAAGIDIAGGSATSSLNLEGLNSLVTKLQNGTSDNDKVALSQLMEIINKSGEKTNTGASITEKVVDIYNPAPAANNDTNNDKGDNK